MPIIIDNNYPNNDPGRINYNRTGAESVRDSSVSSRQGNLSAGSTVTGTIVEKDGNNVTIDVGNNRTVSAKLTGNVNIDVGMKMTFEVSKSSGNQLALRPLYSNLSNSNAAMSALRAAGLPVNDTTLAMTDRMMTEGMSINRNALVDMFRNVSAHTNVSPESIVQMTKLNMPLTDSNVIQFDNYRNFEHQITGDLKAVADGVGELFKEAVTNASEGMNPFTGMSAQDVVKEVLNLIDTDSLETIVPENVTVAGQAVGQAVTGGQMVEAGQPGQVITQEGVIPEMTAKDAESVVASQEAKSPEGLQEAIQTEQGTVQESTQSVAASVKNAVEGFISDIKDIFTPEQQTGEINETLSLTPSEQMSLSADIQNILILAGESADIHEPLDPSQIMSKVKELVNEYPPENVKVMDAEVSAYSEETAEAGDEAKLVNTAQADIDNLAMAKVPDENTVKAQITEKLNELLKSDGFVKLVKDSVKAQMSIKPQDVSQSGKIEELYEKIQRTSSKIYEMMESVQRGDSAVAKAAGALTDNVNFMNQLGEFVSYVQLPLKMAGEDANGELYVYSKKKNLSDNDGNYSALLHLDMEHLGPMDIYVTMKDHTKVTTNFYLQTEELLDFIEQHIDMLTKRLQEKGYDASMRFSKKSPGTKIEPIADEFTKEEPGEAKMVVSRMRFDVRA